MNRISHVVIAPFLAVLVASGSAGAADVAVAGGDLDPGVTNMDVYIGVPKAGSVPAGAACQRAKDYSDYVQAGRWADVAPLFADDAVVMKPSARPAVGRVQIAESYEGTSGKVRAKANVIAVSYVGDDTDCMVTFASGTVVDGRPRYKLTSVDHFTLNKAGKFVRMVAFARSARDTQQK